MYSKHLIVNDGSDWKEVKDVGELLPYFRRSIFGLALSIKTIYLSDLSGLMISAKKTNSTWKSDFEKQKKGDSLNTVLATINIVTKEQVVDIRNVSTDLEKFHDVPELAMDITDEGDWTIQIDNIVFSCEDFFCLFAYDFDSSLLKLFSILCSFNQFVGIKSKLILGASTVYTINIQLGGGNIDSISFAQVLFK